MRPCPLVLGLLAICHASCDSHTPTDKPKSVATPRSEDLPVLSSFQPRDLKQNAITPYMNGDEIISAAIAAVGCREIYEQLTTGRSVLEVETTIDVFRFKMPQSSRVEKFVEYGWFDGPFRERRHIVSDQTSPRKMQLAVVNGDDQWVQINENPAITSQAPERMLTFPNSFFDTLLTVMGEKLTRVRVLTPNGVAPNLVFVEIQYEGKKLATLGLHADTALPWTVEKSLSMDGKSSTVLYTTYRQYRPFGAMTIPTEVVAGRGGGVEMTMRVKSVEFLKEVGDKLFDPPADGAALQPPIIQ